MSLSACEVEDRHRTGTAGSISPFAPRSQRRFDRRRGRCVHFVKQVRVSPEGYSRIGVPQRRLIFTTSKPAAISAEACVCRRAWKVTLGRPRAARAVRQALLRLSGDIGAPSGLQKTRASTLGLPWQCHQFATPKASRQINCNHRAERVAVKL